MVAAVLKKNFIASFCSGMLKCSLVLVSDTKKPCIPSPRLQKARKTAPLVLSFLGVGSPLLGGDSRWVLSGLGGEAAGSDEDTAQGVGRWGEARRCVQRQSSFTVFRGWLGSRVGGERGSWVGWPRAPHPKCSRGRAAGS